MYNRYIPQSDGTYCRKSVPERPTEPKPTPPKPIDPPEPSCPPPAVSVMPGCAQRPRPQSRRPNRHTPSMGIGEFLKQLLPGDFAAEDLLVVILLLLMAGDCPEQPNSALLTLALYLFL